MRIAILGSGRVAKARLRELRARPDVTLAGLASSDAARGTALLEGWDAPVFPDWRELARLPDVEAVMICTRNERHAGMAEAALRAGKHVSVDYPLALSLAEVEALVALAAQQQRTLHVEHIELLSPWVLTFVAALPRIGTLLSLNWTDLSARQPVPGDWTFALESGFSLFAGASVLSRLVHIAGEAHWVSAAEQLRGVQSGSYQARHTTALVGFAHHVTATLQDAVGLAAAGAASQLAATGTEGVLLAGDRKRVVLRTAQGAEELPLSTTPGLFAQDIDAFLNAIQHGKTPYVTLAHEQHTARLADAAQRSVQAKGATMSCA